MTIRRTPTDFVVRERLSDRFTLQVRPERGLEAGFVVFELSKTSLTTPEAVQWMAKSLGVTPGAVEHAGLKDKHAHTVQHVTVAAKSLRPGVPIADTHCGSGWSARAIGYSPEPVRAADIERNRFSIVVRDLSRPAAEEMRRRARILGATTPTSRLLIVNYFGDQRFGSARHGEGWVARHLIKGEFEHALRLTIGTPARKDSGKKRAFTRLCATHWGDWPLLAKDLPRCPERASIEILAAGKGFKDAFTALPYFTQQICVEAFQSHLWNATVRRFVERAARERGGESRLLRTDDPFGEMIFPGVFDAALRGLSVPMLAPESILREPWMPDALAALGAENLALADLRIPGLRRPAFGEAERPVFVDAEEFRMTPPTTDELGGGKRVKVSLEFDLPRGAYATVVLRALGQ